tara:strand:+ start:436 stop:609 length:174 start_codon:yes stop_codon:yes gene_type:complete
MENNEAKKSGFLHNNDPVDDDLQLIEDEVTLYEKLAQKSMIFFPHSPFAQSAVYSFS